jgi:hypothetical protein
MFEGRGLMGGSLTGSCVGTFNLDPGTSSGLYAPSASSLLLERGKASSVGDAGVLTIVNERRVGIPNPTAVSGDGVPSFDKVRLVVVPSPSLAGVSGGTWSEVEVGLVALPPPTVAPDGISPAGAEPLPVAAGVGFEDRTGMAERLPSLVGVGTGLGPGVAELLLEAVGAGVGVGTGIADLPLLRVGILLAGALGLEDSSDLLASLGGLFLLPEDDPFFFLGAIFARVAARRRNRFVCLEGILQM